MALVDTHSIIKELMDAGTSQKKAEVLIKCFVTKEASAYLHDDLATKWDIHGLKSDISTLENKIDMVANKIDINIKWITAIGVIILGILLKDMFA